MSHVAKTFDESEKGKAGALGFLIGVFVILICMIGCFIGYCYHKSAGELRRQNTPVKKRKPFDFDEKEKEHLRAMAAREKDLVEVEEEVYNQEEESSAQIDESRFGSVQHNQNALAEAAMLDYYEKQAEKGKSDHQIAVELI